MNTQAKRKRVPVHGVLLLDKPAGISSTQALAKAKWLLNAEKGGHTGTLDPFATGLLPLCFGEATKFAQDLLDADKTYEATVRLGVTTTTGDTEGDVLETREPNVTEKQVEDALQTLRGTIHQVPPMYSALKRDGKPLYAYAREGVTLDREARQVTIHELVLLEFQPSMIRIRVHCSKGTYVRVLGEDIGRLLGCGAHLSALRRTAIRRIDLTKAVSLEFLSQHSAPSRPPCLLSVDYLLSDLMPIELNETLALRFRQGQRLSLVREGLKLDADQEPERSRLRVYGPGKEFIGTARIDEQALLQPERLVSIPH